MNSTALSYALYGTALAPFALAQFGKPGWALPVAVAAVGVLIYDYGTSDGQTPFQFPTTFFQSSAGLVPLGIYAAGIALTIYKPQYGALIGVATAAGIFYYGASQYRDD